MTTPEYCCEWCGLCFGTPDRLMEHKKVCPYKGGAPPTPPQPGQGFKVTFPAFTLPGFKLSKGQLLNVSLLGVGLVIPPVDITFWPEIKAWNSFVIFDLDWILNPIASWLTWIPGAVADTLKGLLDPISQAVATIPNTVWDIAISRLDAMAEDYYKRHSKEKK